MSGLLSYLFTYDTDTINLKITDPSTKTADIKVSKKQLSEISQYFKDNLDKLYDGYPITLPISNEITREILESLFASKVNITPTNMLGYRILKDLWQIDQIEKIPDKKLLANIPNIAETYETISKYEQLQDLSELLIKTLMFHIQEEIKQNYAISITTLKKLLSRIDYDIDMPEDTLLEYMLKWFEVNKNNSLDQFSECLSLIDTSVLDHEVIREIRSTSPIYDTFKTILQPLFFEALCNGKGGISQRQIKHETCKLLSPSQIADLKTGEFVDAKRDSSYWQRALITNITDSHVFVTYVSSSHDYDESIPKSSNRIAARNSLVTDCNDETEELKLLTPDECKLLKPGDNIDAKTTYPDKWYRSKIIKVSNSTIDVLFYGDTIITRIDATDKRLARFGSFEADNIKAFTEHLQKENTLIPLDKIKELKIGDLVEYKLAANSYQLYTVIQNTSNTLQITPTGQRNSSRSGSHKEFHQYLSYKGTNITDTQAQELEDKKFMSCTKIDELKMYDCISVRNSSQWYAAIIYEIRPTTIRYAMKGNIYAIDKYTNIAASLDTFPIVNKESYEAYLKAKQIPMDIINKFQKDDIIDASDYCNDWYKARVIDTTTNTITVEFIGYASHNNETIFKTSGKLAPYRTFTTDERIARQDRMQGDKIPPQPKYLTAEQINALKPKDLIEFNSNEWQIAKVINTSKYFIQLSISDCEQIYNKKDITVAKLGTYIGTTIIDKYMDTEDLNAGLMPLSKINKLKQGDYIEVLDICWTLAKVVENNQDNIKVIIIDVNLNQIEKVINKNSKTITEVGNKIPFTRLQNFEAALPNF